MKTLFDENNVSIERLITLCRIKDEGGLIGASREGAKDFLIQEEERLKTLSSKIKSSSSPEEKKKLKFSRDKLEDKLTEYREDVVKVERSRSSLYSRQLSELKDALGVELIDSKKALTLEGKELEAITREFLQKMHSFKTRYVDSVETLTIAAGESTLLWLVIPQVLQNFSPEEQKRIRFRNMTSRDAAKAVSSGAVHLAFHDKKHTAPCANITKEMSYSRALVSKKGIIGKNTKSWSSLKNVNSSILGVATLDGGGTTRREVDRLCSQNKDTPQIVLECSSYLQIIQACLTGNYLGIIPEIANSYLHEHLELVKLEELKGNEINLTASYLEEARGNSSLLDKLIVEFDGLATRYQEKKNSL